MARLSLSSLSRIPEAARPAIDPYGLPVGMVHLGIGAFHRAHQAAYTETAMSASGDRSWGICGVTQRSAAVLDQLIPQDGLYTLLQRAADGDRARVIGSVRQVLFAAEQGEEVLAMLAAQATRIVTLTVTEKGYRHDPATGLLNRSDSGIVADASGARPRTVIGQLVRAMQQRARNDAGGFTVVCCDNLPSNGRAVRRLVLDFCDLLPSVEARPLATWIEANVAFPNTMVDRIVPATTDADRLEVRGLLGVDDHGVVVAEPFTQWVIEDAFAGPRPAWERAGATLTRDVAPYEAMKLRLLNGSHSAIAYLGALAGYGYVAEVMTDDVFVSYVRGLMIDEVLPTLDVPEGFDISRYIDDLLTRLSNGALHHRTTQIAMDGSQKLPQRLLGTIRDRLTAGESAPHACLAIAAWMRYVTAGRDDSGRELPVDDPLQARFRQIGASTTSPVDTVQRMLGVRDVFGDDLPQMDGFRAAVVEMLADLSRGDTRSVVVALAGASPA